MTADAADFGELMAREEDGEALVAGQVGDQPAHLFDALWVESADRLVEEDDARAAEQRLCDTEPLAHALGVPADLAVCVAGVQAGEQLKVVSAVEPGVEGRRLDQAAHARQRLAAMACGVEAIDQDAACVRPREAERDPHGGRLAGAVMPEKAVAAPRFDVKRDLVQRLEAAEPFADALQNQCHALIKPLCAGRVNWEGPALGPSAIGRGWVCWILCWSKTEVASARPKSHRDRARLSGWGWGGLAQRRRGAEGYWEGGMQIRQGCSLQLPWSAEKRYIFQLPKR